MKRQITDSVSENSTDSDLESTIMIGEPLFIDDSLINDSFLLSVFSLLFIEISSHTYHNVLFSSSQMLFILNKRSFEHAID